jgi:uncharacterized protein
MSAHEFEISVSELDAGGKDYRFPLRTEWLREALEGSDAAASDKEGAVAVRVSKSGDDVVVHGTLDASLSASCARCLGAANIVISQPITGLFSPKTSLVGAAKDEYEFAAEEAEVMAYEGETVVLDDLIRDELLLEIPMIPLCSEDCPGIRPPPTFEASPAAPSVDPRFAPLLQIKPSRNLKE